MQHCHIVIPLLFLSTFKCIHCFFSVRLLYSAHTHLTSHPSSRSIVCFKESEILSPGGACKQMIVPLPHKVFVYGSLLSNLKNHHVLTDLNNHARLVSENCRTVGMFYLTGLKSNEYPYLSEVPLHESQVSHRITGELYEVSSQALDTLDVFEEHPIEYLRSEIEVENLSPRYEDVNGAKLIVNVYLLKNELRIAEAKSVFESKFVIVNDGDWRSHLNKV